MISSRPGSDMLVAAPAWLSRAITLFAVGGSNMSLVRVGLFRRLPVPFMNEAADISTYDSEFTAGFMEPVRPVRSAFR